MCTNFRLLFFLVFCLFACIDPIEFEYKEQETFLIVDGSFSIENDASVIKLFYTDDLIALRKRPISNADIILVKDAKIREPYEEIEAGVYQLKRRGFIGEPEKKYHIEIALPNGAQYQSYPETLPSLVKGDSVYFEFGYRPIEVGGSIIRKPVMEVFVASSLPMNKKDYWLKWEVSTLYSFPEECGAAVKQRTCFIPGLPNQQQVLLFDGTLFSGNYLTNWKVSEKELGIEDFEFRGKHYFLVNQRSLTQDAYKYWSKIDKIANQTGSIFDAPPAAVKGNIYNVQDKEEFVLGYFELTSTDSLRGFFIQSDFFKEYRFPINVCPTFNNPSVFPDRACCDCQSIKHSTLERPDWF